MQSSSQKKQSKSAIKVHNKAPNPVLAFLYQTLPTWLEAILLFLVLVLLYLWFSGSFAKPSANEDSFFHQSVWFSAELPELLPAWEKTLCRQTSTVSGFSTELQQRCEDVYPTQRPLVKTLPLFGHKDIVPSLQNNDEVKHKTQENYALLQASFQKIFNQKNLPVKLKTHLYENMYFRVGGSALLDCSWRMINELEKAAITAGTHTQHATWSLLRNELLTGGYARYNRFKDMLSVKRDKSFGAVVMPHQWAGFSHSLHQTCKQLGMSPSELYFTTQKNLETLYAQHQAYNKSHIMDSLSQSGHIYFILLAIAAYACLLLSRMGLPFYIYTPMVIVVWMGVYVVTDKLVAGNIIELAHIKLVIVFAALAFLLCSLYRFYTKRAPLIKMYATTSVGFPLLVLLLGVGFYVLLDWSINSGYASKRFVALYQAGYLYLFFAFLSIMPLLYQVCFSLFKLFSHLLYLPWRIANALFDKTPLSNQAKQVQLNTGTLLNPKKIYKKNAIFQIFRFILFVVIALIALLAILVFALGFPNQMVSEVLRLFIILSAAFFISQSTFFEQKQVFSAANVLLISYLFLVVLMQLLAKDQGPIMVLAYGMFILASANMVNMFIARGNSIRTYTPTSHYGFMMLSICFSVLFVFLLANLFQYLATEHGGFRSAERVLSMKHAFASTNDQRAMLLYFMNAVPEGGFGLGNTAWQGDYRGVPAQTQSDYFPMALYGVLGAKKMSLLLVGFFAWIISLCVAWFGTVGRLAQSNNRTAALAAFFAWVTLLWAVFMLVQVTLTITGNFGLTPLTGISLPLFSYGRVGLLAQALLIGLIIQRSMAQPNKLLQHSKATS